MALLAKKNIGPADTLRYILDYGDWLDCEETIAAETLTITVDMVDGGPSTPAPTATINNISVSADGRSLVFYVSGNDPTGVTVGTRYAVNVQITTVIGGSPPGQTKNDHIEFVVVAS